MTQRIRRVACLVLASPILAYAQTPPDGLASDAATAVGQFSMAYPFPAPDGTRLVFQGDFDGWWQLYSLDLDTDRIERVSTSPGDDTHPAFSPDGQWLAFISNAPGNDDVYLLELATGDRRALSPHPGKDGHPKWSADGEWIVFNRTFDPEDREGDIDAAILRVRPDGTDLNVISDSERIETFASFSPDAQSVVFVEWFPNAAGDASRNGELVIVDIRTGQRKRLTETEVFEGFPFWGASGDWIYFTAFTSDSEEQSNAAVYRISPSGGPAEPVSPVDRQRDVRAVAGWDESTLYYNSSSNGATRIYAVPLPDKE